MFCTLLLGMPFRCLISSNFFFLSGLHYFSSCKSTRIHEHLNPQDLSQVQPCAGALLRHGEFEEKKKKAREPRQ